MAKCPSCDSNINSFYMSRLVRANINMSYNASLDASNTGLEVTHMPERESEPDILDTLSEAFLCPVCGAEIPNCGSVDEAYKFLKEV